MYNLYLADDERLVIDTLESIVDWASYGIRLAGASTNGNVACEEILQKDIDIAIVDIRMPGMSGLEIIARVKERKPDTIFIVCSGYSDFSYAREAMKHGTVYYLTKPVGLQELLDAVQIALAKKKEIHAYSDDQIQKLKMEKMISEAILHGQIQPDCDFENFYVASAQLEYLPDYLNVIEQTISEAISSKPFEAYTLFHKDEIILLFTHVSDLTAVTQVLLHITEELKDKINILIQWGVGGNKPHAPDIHHSFNQSKEAYRYAVFMDQRISTIHEVAYNHGFKLDINFAAIMEDMMSPEKAQRVRDHIRDMIKHALEQSISPDSLVLHCTEIINHAINYVKQLYGIPPEEWYSYNYASLKQLSEVKSARKMGEVTTECLLSIVERLNDRMKDYKEKVIHQIKEYIHKNINQSISTIDIAKETNFNPAYISNFFKKKTGKNLTDYITEVKMEKAKELLASSNYKVNQIAEMVGYSDQRYFCLVFKKYSGMTPTQFRDMRNKTR
jgi:two-component system response regulator YesN